MDLILKVFSWPKMIADASGIISASYLHYRLKASSMEGEESFLLVKVYFFYCFVFYKQWSVFNLSAKLSARGAKTFSSLVSISTSLSL